MGKELTHIGLVQETGVYTPEWNTSAWVRLRGTKTRWYDELARWWPKAGEGLVDAGTGKDIYHIPKLALSTVRPMTAVELREPLAAEVMRCQEQLDYARRTVLEMEAALSDSVVLLGAFDKKHRSSG